MTNNIYTAIIETMKASYNKLIAQTDTDPQRWYELFVSEGEEAGTHSVQSGNTFNEVAVHYEQYAIQYGVDRTYIDIWKPDKAGGSKIVCDLYNEHNVYAAIRDHLISTGEIKKLRMVGNFERNENGNIKYTKKNNGEEGYYFYDDIARKYFKDRLFYIPESSGQHGKLERIVIITKRNKRPKNTYTVSDIMNMCHGDEELTHQVMDAVASAQPAAELMQIYETRKTNKL